MDKTTCTLVAIVLCLAMTASSNLIRDVDNGGYIVVGDPIPIEDVPWQVSITDSDGNHFCGGAIISERYIVTSAYCIVYKKAEDIRVRSGSNMRNEGGFLSNVARVTRHEEYLDKRMIRQEMTEYRLPYTPSFDIALIELSEELEFGPGTAPISLYKEPTSLKLRAGKLIQLTGWGYIAELGGDLSDQLLEIKVPILTRATCLSFNSDYNVFCAGNRTEHMVSCSGDSGGPVVWNGTLIGIVSGSQGGACPGPEFAGTVTRIDKFRNWIMTTAENRKIN